jgi:hypothetical protein
MSGSSRVLLLTLGRGTRRDRVNRDMAVRSLESMMFPSGTFELNGLFLVVC